MLKNRFLLSAIALLAVLAANASVADTTLSVFNLTHFDGWVYHRSDVELNRDNISHLRITLLTKDLGEVCTLESPDIDCSGADSLRVEVDYRTITTDYNAWQIGLQIDLLAPDGTVENSVAVPAAAGVYEQTLIATLALPAGGGGEHRLLFSAPKADGNNCAAVRGVKVYGVTREVVSNPQLGDVNADGQVDVSDLNLIVDIILGFDCDPEFIGRATLNGDSSVDVSDVNILVDIILKN